MGKRKLDMTEDERAEQDLYLKQPGSHTVVGHQLDQKKRLIVVLERANLEAVKAGKHYELMNSDQHLSLIRKYKKDIKNCRPDILHQCLLMLQDSPLNQAGLLQVFIHTEKNVLISIDPGCRIPRTFKRFAGLMVQLLHKFSVRAAEGNKKLMETIKNPVSDHFPAGAKRLLMSYDADNCVPASKLPEIADDKPIVVIIGAMAHGKVEVDYSEDTFAISKYHLSGALACAKVCSAFETAWNVL